MVVSYGGKDRSQIFTGGGIGRSIEEIRAESGHDGIELYVLSSKSTQFSETEVRQNYRTDFAK